MRHPSVTLFRAVGNGQTDLCVTMWFSSAESHPETLFYRFANGERDGKSRAAKEHAETTVRILIRPIGTVEQVVSRWHLTMEVSHLRISQLSPQSRSSTYAACTATAARCMVIR